MKQLVIMPGGFHPFHAGHLALYNSARQAFPNADVKVAATNDTSTRPFPFRLKEKLAQLAGVSPGDFYQVKSPFRAEEITKSYNPADTQLIFVRSEKDATKPPQPGGIKRDGNPAYLQPISDQMAPMTQHAYMAYLPTVEFGPGMTSATQIRTAWPSLTERQRTALVMSLYPNTQSNPKLANTVVKMLDTAMGAENLNEFARGDFNGGDDSNDLQLYLNVAKKLNMKKYKPSTAHNLIAKKMAELVDTVDDEKVDWARHMARKAQGLPNMLDQGVAEAFDTPLPITWEKGMHGDIDALAKLPDGSNLSIMFNKQDNIKPDDKTWMVEFYRNNSQEVTGEGDAQKVFSTVLVAIQQFIKKYKPLKIYFSASKEIDPTIYYGPDDVQPNPESRAKLYDRMVLRYAKSWGYKFFRADNGSSVMYQLSKIKPNVDEQVTRQMNIGGMRASYQSKYNQPIAEDYLDEARS